MMELGLGKYETALSLTNCFSDYCYSPRCPHPEFEGDDIDELTPVPPFPHFNTPLVDEKNALVMNIVLPPLLVPGPHPILVYVHGGSLLYGGSYLAIFDAVRLVSQSVKEGRPIVVINFNYRVGLGGFLASTAIANELSRDGFEGCGNFGFTDQQIAFEWVQHFGQALGGDIQNITAVGESAGGISISNQLLARQPPIFHRAVCMSGLAAAIPAWTRDQHQTLFDAVCRWFDLDPNQPDVMEELRKIPEKKLANASPSIFGVPSGTGNPCLDGWFYEKDPREVHSAPSWLKSYMVGDVYHEGVIFHLNIMEDQFESWRDIFLRHIADEVLVNQIFDLYGLSANLTQAELLEKFEYMAGDAIFRIPNYLTAIRNETIANSGSLFLYHFDQRSRIKNSLEGTAYHAYELLYLFQNLEDEMNEEERKMSSDFTSAWVKFANGDKPWISSGAAVGNQKWKIWGPQGNQATVSEAEDEGVRAYSRLNAMLNIGEPGLSWHKWFLAIDEIVNKRGQLGVMKSDVKGDAQSDDSATLQKLVL